MCRPGSSDQRAAALSVVAWVVEPVIDERHCDPVPASLKLSYVADTKTIPGSWVRKYLHIIPSPLIYPLSPPLLSLLYKFKPFILLFPSQGLFPFSGPIYLPGPILDAALQRL